jgi:photosystem II stability/assembly factor-like uncharacterized protein
MMKNTHASIRKTLLPASMLLCVSFSSAAMDINLPAWSIHMLENSASLRGSAIIDQSLWVTGTKSTVFVSQDGGKSWQSLDASNKQDITGFYTLAASDMVFLAAGADGKIGVVSFKPK